MAPRGFGRQAIAKYFDFGDDHAICRLCQHRFKSERVFNLKLHVMKMHKIKEEEFILKELVPIKADVTKFKIKLNKKQLLRSYIGLVAEDGIPLNVLNSKNFRNIIDPICKGMSEKLGERFSLSSERCQQSLELSAYNIRNVMKRDLNKRLLSLKLDSVTSLSQNIFSLSAQLIKEDQIKSYILGMVECRGVKEKDFKSFETEILNTLSKYEVKLEHIVAITSGMGLNINNHSSLITLSFSIFENNQQHLHFEEDNELYLKNIEMFEYYLQINIGEIQIQPCTLNIVQACFLDLTKNEEIKKCILNSRNLVKHLRNPINGCEQHFDEEGLEMPQIDCSSKLGSTYNMINALRNAKVKINSMYLIKSEFPKERFELSEYFWNFIEAYCMVLEPLQKVLIICQEELLHYGNFYAEWLRCKLCTERNHQIADRYHVQLISQILIQSLEKRNQEVLSNPQLISCLYLDPRFQHTLNPQQKFQASTYLKKLFEKLKAINEYNSQIVTEHPSTSVKLESKDELETVDDYLNEYLERSYVPKSNEEIEVGAKIENLLLPFLHANSNVLQFWKDKEYSDPELYALSKVCFAIPANQLPVSSVFDSLKYIVADKRSSITRDILENILLVKLNSSYLDQAIGNLQLFEFDKV